MHDAARQKQPTHPETGPAPPAAVLEAKLAHLRDILRRHGRVLVAFSGGVDSTLLLKVAVETLGPENAVAVLGESASLARREREEAVALAASFGARLRVLHTGELEDENYARNASNRCYFCKNELYGHLESLARELDDAVILDGTNADDAGDFRPGRQAARERGVASPLLEAGLGKAEIRALSRRLGLPTWDKPEMPCLASRIPYGTRVDAAKLSAVERAEDVVRDLGLRGARVRHHGDIARIELDPRHLPLVADGEVRERLVAGVRAAGFRYVTVDLEPYRRGRLNEALPERGEGTSAARDASDGSPPGI